MLEVTEGAARQISRIVAENAGKYTGLRVGLQDGGCSGYSYLIEFERTAEPEDVVIEASGARVYVHPLHVPFIEGSKLLWKEDRFEQGFSLDNPNVKRTCGCGVSFDV
jgi:iron-sulfur cluster assembly protein